VFFLQTFLDLYEVEAPSGQVVSCSPRNEKAKLVPNENRYFKKKRLTPLLENEQPEKEAMPIGIGKVFQPSFCCGYLNF